MDSSGVDRPTFELLEMERVVGSVIDYYADDLGFMSTTALAEEIVVLQPGFETLGWAYSSGQL
jgi:hypothetical protein